MSAIDAGGRAAARRRKTAEPTRRRPASATTRKRPTRARPAKTARTRALGRTASLTNATVVLVIGVVAFAIVALQVGVLRANMDTASVQSQTRQVRSQTSDIQNDIATQLSDGRIDAAARSAHMVWAPPDAVRSVPAAVKAGKRASTR